MDDDPTNERKTYAGTDLLVTCFGEWVPLPQTNDFKFRLTMLTLRCIEVQECRHAFETPMQFLIASRPRVKGILRSTLVCRKKSGIFRSEILRKNNVIILSAVFQKRVRKKGQFA